jgi:hypothetical protein
MEEKQAPRTVSAPYSIYVGCLCVSCFVAMVWVLVCVLLTPLSPDMAATQYQLRIWLIVFGLGLDVLFSCAGVWALMQHDQHQRSIEFLSIEQRAKQKA